MEKKCKNFAVLFCTSVFLFGLALLNLLLPDNEVSLSERRQLKQFPTFSASSLFSGKFASEFEAYALDQFPLRDSFRTLKTYYSTYCLGQRDSNGLYEENGYLVQMEYPLDPNSLHYAAEVFSAFYDDCLADSDCKVYLSVVPDKNAYLAESSGHLSMDYSALTGQLRSQLPQMEYIDLFPLLSHEDYYRTDSHWRQECLPPVAAELAEKMGTDLIQEYTLHTADSPFYGVYAGQLPLKTQADTICWLSSESLDACTAYDHENRRPIPLYDLSLLQSGDPYEMFLSGPLSLITIENPNATSQKELVVFRDSFGSSIAPLLAEGYQKITLVDIRYMLSITVDNYITFEDQDVLFLYSTLVLNNSQTLK